MTSSDGRSQVPPDDRVAALRAANPGLVKMVEASPLVMAAWDDDFRCVAVSDGSLRRIHGGRTREQVTGGPLASFLDPSFRDQVMSVVERMTVDGQVSSTSRVVGDDGVSRRFRFIGIGNVAPGIHMTVSWLGIEPDGDRSGGHEGRDEDAVRLLVVAPDDLTASLIEQAAGLRPGLDVVATCVEADSIESALISQRPQVALVASSPIAFAPDGSPEWSVVDLVKRIVRLAATHSIDCGVVVLSHRGGIPVLRDALTAGAMGALGSEDDYTQLEEAVRKVAAGGGYLSQALVSNLLTRDRREDRTISPGESEVLRLLALGCTNREAADELGISVRTVESRRASVLNRLDLKSRRELVSYAIDNQLIP